jgi:hypothetical protein
MPVRILVVALVSLLCCSVAWKQLPKGPFYRCSDGKVRFISDAPLEKIEASSERLRGAVDAGANTFAWTVAIRSFKGFNSDLQLEHFNENYMESAKYTDAKFEGKIIEDVDCSKDGVYPVRAKGRLRACLKLYSLLI